MIFKYCINLKNICEGVMLIVFFVNSTILFREIAHFRMVSQKAISFRLIVSQEDERNENNNSHQIPQNEITYILSLRYGNPKQ